LRLDDEREVLALLPETSDSTDCLFLLFFIAPYVPLFVELLKDPLR